MGERVRERAAKNCRDRGLVPSTGWMTVRWMEGLAAMIHAAALRVMTRPAGLAIMDDHLRSSGNLWWNCPDRLVFSRHTGVWLVIAHTLTGIHLTPPEPATWKFMQEIDCRWCVGERAVNPRGGMLPSL